MKAQICPVCNGKGEIRDEDSENPMAKKTCHGCGGKGWVVVPDEPVYIPEPRRPFPYHPYEPYSPWKRYQDPDEPFRHRQKYWCMG